MDKYLEAYGACYKKLLFFAVRFKKPIIKVKIDESSEGIDTSNILVIYSKSPVTITFNTLTYIVNVPCFTDELTISVKTGNKSELLHSLTNKCEIYYFHVHDSILYGCGTSNCISFKYKSIPKTVAFKALYMITRAYQNKNINIYDFISCHHFKRNKLKWEKWSSWWGFIRDLINNDFNNKVGIDITLQTVSRIKKIWKNTLKLNPIIEMPELNFCEIGLENTDTPGILCSSENSSIKYISPMIISEQYYDSLPIKDKNNIKCDLWFPLYTNLHHWMNHCIYFYIKQLSLNKIYIEEMLSFLDKTTIEKYKLIQENIIVISEILTDNNPKA